MRMRSSTPSLLTPPLPATSYTPSETSMASFSHPPSTHAPTHTEIAPPLIEGTIKTETMPIWWKTNSETSFINTRSAPTKARPHHPKLHQEMVFQMQRSWPYPHSLPHQQTSLGCS